MKKFDNGKLYDKNKKEIKKGIILFPVGFTVGVDVKYQEDKIKGVICLSKYTIPVTGNYTDIQNKNINNTNIKDFL